MTDLPNHKKDTERAYAALSAIVDGRDVVADRSSIMVTLEHVVASLMVVSMGGDHQKAAAMLNEGLVPGVEARLAMHASLKRANRPKR